MQSILRSSSQFLIKNNNKAITTSSQFLITRSFCSDNHNHDSQHQLSSFEKFKENRNLVKKKAELIKEITKSKLLGDSEKVFQLQQQVSSIEKVLDPNIESFSIQSKKQKETELEQWKSFISKKGIKSKSQLKSINLFEFERFKNTGLLDAELEKQEKDKIDQLQELNKNKPILKLSKKEKLEIDNILHDPFDKSSFIADESELNEFAFSEELDGEDEELSHEEFIKSIEEQSKKDPEFKRMVTNFLDDSIPLKDKLIFKTQANESIESSPIERKKFLKVIKLLEKKSKQEEKQLKEIIRNNEILSNSLDKESGDAVTGVKKLKSVLIEDNTIHALHPDSDQFGGSYLLENNKIEPLPFIAPFDIIFGDEVKSEAKRAKLLEKSRKDPEFTRIFGEDGSNIAKKASSRLDSDLTETVDENEDSEALNELSEDEDIDEDEDEDDDDDESDSPEGFEHEVLLAKNEDPDMFEPDMGLQSIALDGRRVERLKEDTPVVKAFKDSLVVKGRISDMETELKHSTDIPEFESPLLMQHLKMHLDKKAKEEEKQLLETNDPQMIRNFLKYKVDQAKDAAEKQKEENFREYSLALEKVQKTLTQRSMEEESMGTVNKIYNPSTGKLFVPKKKNPKCMLCQDPNWEVDPLNVPFLTLYLNEEGDILPRNYSGNCLKHQKKIGRTIKHAKSLGIFSYKNGTFTIEDPNVYPLTKSELEEYNKWYNASYSDEEWNQVVDELGELEIDEESPEDEKQDQQEQVMLEFGIESTDVGKMYSNKEKQ